MDEEEELEEDNLEPVAVNENNKDSETGKKDIL